MERRFFAPGSIPQVPRWELGDGTAQVATAPAWRAQPVRFTTRRWSRAMKWSSC